MSDCVRYDLFTLFNKRIFCSEINEDLPYLKTLFMIMREYSTNVDVFDEYIQYVQSCIDNCDIELQYIREFSFDVNSVDARLLSCEEHCNSRVDFDTLKGIAFKFGSLGAAVLAYCVVFSEFPFMDKCAIDITERSFENLVLKLCDYYIIKASSYGLMKEVILTLSDCVDVIHGDYIKELQTTDNSVSIFEFLVSNINSYNRGNIRYLLHSYIEVLAFDSEPSKYCSELRSFAHTCIDMFINRELDVCIFRKYFYKIVLGICSYDWKDKDARDRVLIDLGMHTFEIRAGYKYLTDTVDNIIGFIFVDVYNLWNSVLCMNIPDGNSQVMDDFMYDLINLKVSPIELCRSFISGVSTYMSYDGVMLLCNELASDCMAMLMFYNSLLD